MLLLGLSGSGCESNMLSTVCIPSSCGMLVYSDLTSIVISLEFFGRDGKVSTFCRKSVVSLM